VTAEIEVIYDDTSNPNMGPIDHEIHDWLVERIPHTENLAPCRGIGLRRRDGPILAAAAFNEFRGRDVQYHAACDDPKVLTPGRIGILLSYPFEQLGVERVSCVIASSNRRSRRVVEGLGWVHEGTVRKFYSDDIDGIIYGMLREECRWLGG